MLVKTQSQTLFSCCPAIRGFFHTFLTHQNWRMTADGSPQSQNTIFTGGKKKKVWWSLRYQISHSHPGFCTFRIYLNVFTNWVDRGACDLTWFCQLGFQLGLWKLTPQTSWWHEHSYPILGFARLLNILTPSYPHWTYEVTRTSEFRSANL